MANPNQDTALLTAALNYYQAGQFDAAERSCRQALENAPDHLQTRYLLGTILSQKGQPAAAITTYEAILEQDPTFAAAHYSLGNLKAKAQQVEAAIAHYQEALATRPTYIKAQLKLAVLLESTGSIVAAGQLYEQVLTQDAGNVMAHLALGRLARDRADAPTAIAHFQAVLQQQPNLAEAHLYMGVTQYEQGERAKGTEHVEQALVLNPNLAGVQAAMGNILLDRQETAAAITHLKRALVLRPEYPEALNTLGSVLIKTEQFEAAATYLNQALTLKPDFTAAYCTLGNLRVQQQQFTEAIALYEKALAIAPDYAEAHADLGLAYLRLGDYPRGFTEYEWRVRCQGENGKALVPDFPLPRWDGSDPSGKTLLIFAEQGFGDTLQFIRFAPLLRERGARLILNCPAPLHRLLGTLTDLAAINSELRFPMAADAWTPSMSLPHWLNIDLATLPATVPYLQIPADAQVTLPTVDPQPALKVGIVWACSPGSTHLVRSCPLERFLNLASALPDVAFYSLQKQAPERDHRTLAAHADKIIDLADQLQDFADTAAAIAQLDLVISVDTSVAHLAGALGQPVWTLLAQVPDWRWLVEREDSPWYPTMHLFRQTEAGDWNGVFDRLQQTLCESFSLTATEFVPLGVSRWRSLSE
ncbi:MAG: tetratricopeptide repeat protein [Cyanobacteria bacterium P01_F01_bin.86]